MCPCIRLELVQILETVNSTLFELQACIGIFILGCIQYNKTEAEEMQNAYFVFYDFWPPLKPKPRQSRIYKRELSVRKFLCKKRREKEVSQNLWPPPGL